VKRIVKDICLFCEAPLADTAAPFCSDCGRPTPVATHQDRVAWEVRQWRQVRGTAETAVKVETAPAPQAKPETTQTNGHRNVATIERPAENESWFNRLVAWLRKAFATPALDPANLAQPPVRKEPSPVIAPPVVEQPSLPAALIEKPQDPPAPAKPEPKPELPRAEAEPVVPPSPPRPSQLRLASRAQQTPLRAPVAEPAKEPEIVPEPVAVLAPQPAPPAPEEKAQEPLKAKKPAARKKKSQTPTNKDLLKRTLNVVTRVEKRVAHLEEEVAESVATMKSSSPKVAKPAVKEPEPKKASTAWIGNVPIKPAEPDA
jgi:hypothetical protein